jgi:cell division protein FtsB
MGFLKSGWPRLLSGLLIFLAVSAFYRLSVHDRLVALGDSWSQERELEAKILQLREENTNLEGIIQDLSPGGKEIDRIVREDLRWVGPREGMINLPGKE